MGYLPMRFQRICVVSVQVNDDLFLPPSLYLLPTIMTPKHFLLLVLDIQYPHYK